MPRCLMFAVGYSATSDTARSVGHDVGNDEGDAMFAMGWFEIIIVALLTAIVLVALLPGVHDVADETVVPGISAETADQVLFRELSDLPSLTLVEAHAGSYTLARRSI